MYVCVYIYIYIYIEREIMDLARDPYSSVRVSFHLMRSTNNDTNNDINRNTTNSIDNNSNT